MLKPILFALLCTSAIACTTGRTGPTTAPLAPTPIAQLEPSPQEPSPQEPSPHGQQDSLRNDLSVARAQNLGRLEAYAVAGAFPKNQVRPGLLNVFRDDEGHLCAVANLINIDGHTGLINETAVADNFIVLADVGSGPLLGWILESGFTQEEIGMIQVPYMGEFRQEIQIVDEQQLAAARAAETERVRSALLQVHQAIAANTNHSLDVAVRRATTNSTVARMTPPRFATPPR